MGFIDKLTECHREWDIHDDTVAFQSGIAAVNSTLAYPPGKPEYPKSSGLNAIKISCKTIKLIPRITRFEFTANYFTI